MKKKYFRREEKIDAPLTAYKEKSDAPLTAADFKYRRQYKDHAYVTDQVCYFPQLQRSIQKYIIPQHNNLQFNLADVVTSLNTKLKYLDVKSRGVRPESIRTLIVFCSEAEAYFTCR